MNKRIFINGEQINGLMFIKEIAPNVQPNGKTKRKCLVMCSCGNEFETMIYSFWHSTVSRCRQCNNKIVGYKNSTHNLSNHKLFTIWYDIKRRCLDKGNKHYEKYGANGIKIHEAWIKDFKCFYDYCISLDSYDENKIGIGGFTIDRIDTLKGYEPNNIRFVDATIQNFNKKLQRNNKTGYRGISKRNNGKFQAQMRLNRTTYYIGTFDTIEMAIKERNRFIDENNIPKDFLRYE